MPANGPNSRLDGPVDAELDANVGIDDMAESDVSAGSSTVVILSSP